MPSVQFNHSGLPQLSLVQLRTDSHPLALQAVKLALSRLGVRVVRAEPKIAAKELHLWLYLVADDGHPIDVAREPHVCDAVSEALVALPSGVFPDPMDVLALAG